MSSDTSRDLLFGLLALQNGLIDQGQLVAAFQAWTLAKERPLAEHLSERGTFDAEDRAAVEALVSRHLKKHGGSTARSLASLRSATSLQGSLAELKDSGLASSLAVPPSGDDLVHTVDLPSVTAEGGSVLGRLSSDMGKISRVVLPDTDHEDRPPAPSLSDGDRLSLSRPAAIACSARSPAAGWELSTGAGTSILVATWP